MIVSLALSYATKVVRYQHICVIVRRAELTVLMRVHHVFS